MTLNLTKRASSSLQQVPKYGKVQNSLTSFSVKRKSLPPSKPSFRLSIITIAYILALTFSAYTSANAQTFTVNGAAPPNGKYSTELQDNGPALTVNVSAQITSGQTIAWSASPQNTVTIATNPNASTTCTITPIAPGTTTISAAIPQTGGTGSQTVSFELDVTAPTLALSLAKSSGTIYVGDTLQPVMLTIDGKALTSAQALNVTWPGLPPNIGSIAPPSGSDTNFELSTASAGNNVTFTAQLQYGPGKYPLQSNPLTLNISPDFLIVSPINPFYQDQQYNLHVQLNGVSIDGTAEMSKITWTPSGLVTNGVLQATTAGPVPLVATYQDGAAYAQTPVPLYALPAVAKIIITPPTSSIEVGQPAVFQGVCLDSDGKTISPQPTITWQAYGQYQTSAGTFQGNVFTAATAGTTVVIANANGFQQPITIQVSPPAETKTIEVKLDTMDDQQASETYGVDISKRFFCEQVTITNDFQPSDPTESADKKVIVFSDSIVAFVTFEKRYVGGKPTPAGVSPGWSNVKNADFNSYAVPGSPYVTDELTQTINAKGGDQAVRVFSRAPYPVPVITGGEAARDQSNSRNIAFNVVSGIATLLSFSTSVNLLKGSAPNVLDKFTNLLVPGVESLFPNLLPTQKQNLLNDMMNPSETIDANKSIQKTIFFPKNAFTGVLTEFETRISAITPSYFYVKAAIVQDLPPSAVAVQGAQQSGTSTP